MVRKLEGHGHWVNFMTLNTDIVIRTGAFDHTEKSFKVPEEAQEYARERYEKVIKECRGERLVSCSDDNTMFLWDPSRSNKPICRMTGPHLPLQAWAHILRWFVRLDEPAFISLPHFGVVHDPFVHLRAPLGPMLPFQVH